MFSKDAQSTYNFVALRKHFRRRQLATVIEITIDRVFDKHATDGVIELIGSETLICTRFKNLVNKNFCFKKLHVIKDIESYSQSF